MDSLTPDGMTIHKRSRTRALLQRARSAPGCLGLMARMHTVHARYKRRFLSANEAAGWAAARRPSFARSVLWLYRKILMSYSLFMRYLE